ncbi:EAL domain-containing protein [Vibrio amylolyticus]|uniref:EAL domain-containing protein n=1 Tax=Vibrio amylolyticus TaxID=2847292 RepID=UPI00354B9C2E
MDSDNNVLENSGITEETFEIVDQGLSSWVLHEWKLNLEKREFTFDKAPLESLLNARGLISSMDDVLSYMPPTQQNEVKDALVKVLKTGKSQYIDCIFMPKESGFVQIEIFMERPEKNVVCGTFRPLIGISSLSDICEVFQAVFDNQHHGILVTDSDTRILTCNRHFEQLKGYQKNEILGLKASIFNAGKHSPSFYKDMWTQIEDRGYWTGTILSRHASGSVSPQDMTLQKIVMNNGRTYYLGSFVDLSDQLSRVSEKGLGGVDLLTQLPTKEKFTELLEELCGSNAVESRKVVIALQPSFEDHILLEYRQVLSNILSRSRSSSIVGYLSSGVFVVCVESVSRIGLSGQRSMMQSIRRFFKEIKTEAGYIHKGVITGRVGVSIIGYDTDVPKRAIAHSMQAMMENPPNSHSNISFYHSKTHQELERKKRLEDIVKSSIMNHELCVYYQPIINANTWEIDKFEALCRFPSIDGIDFTTQEMINLAEDLELIPKLDGAVGVIALGDLQNIRSVCGEGIGLTINRSLNTPLGTEQVLQDTFNMLEQHADHFESITIELTESAYFESSPRQGEALQSMRDKGVSIAIDDFGTGYSSFSYLRNRHFDMLKIDREFVTDIQKGSDKYHIVKMITDLSHTLGVKVIAEGVETVSELTVLRSLNIDYVQGFLFSKPLALENVENALNYKTTLADELETFKHTAEATTLCSLASQDITVLEPEMPLYLVNETIGTMPSGAFPIIVNKRCVGIVSQSDVNLHMTPQMGTDLESTKEAAIWRRPVNQLMRTTFSKVDSRYSLDDLGRLLEEKIPFPWVLVNDVGNYKGVVESNAVMNHLLKIQ